MDPNVTLREALQALADYDVSKNTSDLNDATLKLEDLLNWLDNDGFPPIVRNVRVARLTREAAALRGVPEQDERPAFQIG